MSPGRNGLNGGEGSVLLQEWQQSMAQVTTEVETEERRGGEGGKEGRGQQQKGEGGEERQVRYHQQTAAAVLGWAGLGWAGLDAASLLS